MNRYTSVFVGCKHIRVDKEANVKKVVQVGDVCGKNIFFVSILWGHERKVVQLGINRTNVSCDS